MSPELAEHLKSLPIWVFRLVDRSILIAYDRGTTDGMIKLGRPMEIIREMKPQGMQIALIPWMPGLCTGNGASEEILIKVSHVIARLEADLDLRSGHAKFFLQEQLKTICTADEIQGIMKPGPGLFPGTTPGPRIKFN